MRRKAGAIARFIRTFWPSDFGPIANLPDFVRKAQLANYEDFRAMYEGRLAKLFKPCTGVLTWMSNPAQPSFVWQIYSYDLEPFASLFAAKKACEPVHIQMNQTNFHVMVINNTPQMLRGMESRVRVFNLDGALKYERRMPVAAPPTSATDLGKIDWPTDLSPVHFVKLELDDRDGKIVSDNFYWRGSSGSSGRFHGASVAPGGDFAGEHHPPRRRRQMPARCDAFQSVQCRGPDVAHSDAAPGI